MPRVNIKPMNGHLAKIIRYVSLDAISLLVLDGTSWQGSPRLTVLYQPD